MQDDTREAGIVRGVVDAEDEQVLAGAQCIQVQVEMLARRVGDAVVRFDGLPETGVEGVFTKAQRTGCVASLDVYVKRACPALGAPSVTTGGVLSIKIGGLISSAWRANSAEFEGASEATTLK